MANTRFPDLEQVRQVIAYEPDTGKLTWLARPRGFFPTEGARKSWNSRYAGTEAFTTNERGYRSGNLLGKGCYAHRVIVALATGAWPEEVDHINGVKSDNRLANLRVADRVSNQRNMKLNKRNTSGTPGLYFRNGVWRVAIGGRIVGFFKEKDDAVAARKAAERELNYHANHGRRAA